jgi:hypothetical protein
LGLKIRRGRSGGLSLKTTGWMVSRVCPQNWAKVPRKNGAHMAEL